MFRNTTMVSPCPLAFGQPLCCALWSFGSTSGLPNQQEQGCVGMLPRSGVQVVHCVVWGSNSIMGDSGLGNNVKNWCQPSCVVCEGDPAGQMSGWEVYGAGSCPCGASNAGLAVVWPSPAPLIRALFKSLDSEEAFRSTGCPFGEHPGSIWWLAFYFLQILFMNKTDLFREKILYSGRHLRFYLPSYQGMSLMFWVSSMLISTFLHVVFFRQGIWIYSTCDLTWLCRHRIWQINKGDLGLGQPPLHCR